MTACNLLDADLENQADLRRSRMDKLCEGGEGKEQQQKSSHEESAKNLVLNAGEKTILPFETPWF